MTFNFDTLPDRQGTDSVKWEILPDWDHPHQSSITDRYVNGDLLPMWVADMDFSCPEVVTRALAARAAHPVYGYTLAGDGYRSAVTGWMQRRHGWTVDPQSIVVTPGVVPALHLLVQAFTRPGQKVLVQRPVYYPFFSAIRSQGCEVVSSSLKRVGGRYAMDIKDLEAKCADPDVTLAIFCNPHNPVGRVWSPDEIRAFGTCCAAHNIQVVADEIHGDLILPGNRFTPFATAGDFGETAITCTSPSKTFNLAGLHTANIIIPDPDRRSRFTAAVQGVGLMGPNPFGSAACQAAYTEGEPWLEALLPYLDGNFKQLEENLKSAAPNLSVTPLQGTYLAWIDFTKTGLPHEQVRNRMREFARVVMDEGQVFGPEGEGFMRMNIACPRSVISAAAERIASAFQMV